MNLRRVICLSFCLGRLLLRDSACAKDASSNNRYELVNEALAPVIAVLTPNGSRGNHALDLEAILGDVTGLPPQYNGAHIRIAYQFAEKLLVQFPSVSGPATVCRNGQSVWAVPKAAFLPIVEHLKAPFSTQPLPPLELDAKKAVFLPALLDVRDAGQVQFNGGNYRIVDVRPIAVTAKQQDSNNWPARLWIGPDHRVAQLALRFASWSATLAIKKLEFAPTLPPEVWNPPPDQHDNVAAVPGEKLSTLVEGVLKQNK